ncbi:MAG: hypothetical protein ACRD6X_13985 [Pyrinomonadaceae bacterium]
MASRKEKKKKSLIFDSIRKPVAPHSRLMGNDRPEEQIHPSQRKSKHKKKPEIEDSNGDI